MLHKQIKKQTKKGFTHTPNFLLSKNGTVGNRKKKNLVCGFTLIEMLVSVTLFTIVVMTAVGVIITILNANKHTRAVSIAMGNIESVFETMFREVSAGSSYRCGSSGNKEQRAKPKDCPNSFKDSFVFEGVSGNDDSWDDQIIYRLNTTDHSLEVSFNNGDNFERLTDSRTVVEDFRASVLGNSNPHHQPAIYLSIRGYINEGGDKHTDFALQTMATQRLDLRVIRKD